MKSQVFKFISAFIILATTLAVPANSAYALDCEVDYTDPGPQHIVCPIIKGINLFIYFAGVVVTIVIILGVIKLSTSAGDPRAAQGAWLTFTWAGVGLAVVVGSVAIILIMGNLFNIESTLIEDPFTYFQDALINLIENITPNECLVEGPGVC